jgi:hypothetical protein
MENQKVKNTFVSKESKNLLQLKNSLSKILFSYIFSKDFSVIAAKGVE